MNPYTLFYWAVFYLWMAEKGLDGKLYKKKKKTLTSPLPYNKTLCTKVIFKVISLQIYNINLSSANIFGK